MKYAIIIGDGMSDYRHENLGNKTPLELAKKPYMDMMAQKGIIGFSHNVPMDMVPESDTANLAVLGYDPKIYSKGRSPLEAVSMGIDMKPDETAFRINTVALSEGDVYEELTILDHSADEIPTEESRQLIETLEAEMGDEIRKYYTGVSYRHCLIWKDAPKTINFNRPHDILGSVIGEYLPQGEDGKPYYDIMKKSWEILKNHPVNIDRKKRGLLPANSLWIWSPGKKPFLTSFEERFGLKGTVVSAVDLIKGIGLCAGLKVPDIEGATGNIHTNYEGKAQAAIDAFRNGDDFVYVHVEAPDECGHRAEIENKVLSIEYLDSRIIKPIYDYLESIGEDFKIMFLPDHPTPLCKRTHSLDAVPYVMYTYGKDEKSGALGYDEYFGHEKEGAVKAKFYSKGWDMMDEFVEK